MCLQSLWLLSSVSSLLACCLPTLDSVNNADSVSSQTTGAVTTGAVHRMKSDTTGVVSRMPSGWRALRLYWMEEASGQHIARGTTWPRSSQCGL